jgi:hypothetical protein
MKKANVTASGGRRASGEGSPEAEEIKEDAEKTAEYSEKLEKASSD